MNEEIQPKVLYKITAYDSDYIKETPDKVRTLNGNIYYYYDFKKHRYLSQFVHDEFDIYDEIKNLKQENRQLKDRIEKATKLIEKYKKDTTMRDVYRYDDLLKILRGEENNNLPNSK